MEAIRLLCKERGWYSGGGQGESVRQSATLPRLLRGSHNPRAEASGIFGGLTGREQPGGCVFQFLRGPVALPECAVKRSPAVFHVRGQAEGRREADLAVDARATDAGVVVADHVFGGAETGAQCSDLLRGAHCLPLRLLSEAGAVRRAG